MDFYYKKKQGYKTSKTFELNQTTEIQSVNIHSTVDNLTAEDDIFTYVVDNTPCDKDGYIFEFGREESISDWCLIKSTNKVYKEDGNGGYYYEKNGTQIPCDKEGNIIGDYITNIDGESHKLFVNLTNCNYKVNIEPNKRVLFYKNPPINIPCDNDGFLYETDEFGNKILCTDKYVNCKFVKAYNFCYYEVGNMYTCIGCDEDGYVYYNSIKENIEFNPYSDEYCKAVDDSLKELRKKIDNQIIKYTIAKNNTTYTLSDVYYLGDNVLDVKNLNNNISNIVIEQIPSEKEIKTSTFNFDISKKEFFTITPQFHKQIKQKFSAYEIQFENLEPCLYDIKIPLQIKNITFDETKLNFKTYVNDNEIKNDDYIKTTSQYDDGTPCDEYGYVYAMDGTGSKYKLYGEDGVTQLTVNGNATDGYYYEVNGIKITCDEDGYVYETDESGKKYKLYNVIDVENNIYEYADGILCDGDGKIYVVDSYNNIVEDENVKQYYKSKTYINIIKTPNDDLYEIYVNINKNLTENNKKIKFEISYDNITLILILNQNCVENYCHVIPKDTLGTLSSIGSESKTETLSFERCDENGLVYNQNKLQITRLFNSNDLMYNNGTPCDEEGYVYATDANNNVYKEYYCDDASKESFKYLDNTPCDEDGYVYETDESGNKYNEVYNVAGEKLKAIKDDYGYYYLIDKNIIPCDEEGYVYVDDGNGNKITHTITIIQNENGYYYEVNDKQIPCDEEGYVYSIKNEKTYKLFDEYSNKGIIFNGEICNKSGLKYKVDSNSFVDMTAKGDTNIWSNNEYSDGTPCDANGYIFKYYKDDDGKNYIIKIYNQFDDKRYSYLDGTPCDNNGEVDGKKLFEDFNGDGIYEYDNILCDGDGNIYDVNNSNERYKIIDNLKEFSIFQTTDKKYFCDKDGFIYKTNSNKYIYFIYNTSETFNNIQKIHKQNFFFKKISNLNEAKSYTLVISQENLIDDRDIYIPFMSFNNLGDKVKPQIVSSANIKSISEIDVPMDIENNDKIIIYKAEIDDLSVDTILTFKLQNTTWTIKKDKENN